MMHKFSKTFFCSILCMSFSALGALSAKSETRKIAFATDYPTGTLSIVQNLNGHYQEIGKFKARGPMSLNVPSNCHVQLELNPHCIEESDKLKSMPTDGIDSLRISYLSMDEGTLVVNKALAALPVFKKPLNLQCFRTDVTDAGVLGFKSLSVLTRLSLFMCYVNGSFLKETKQLQNLQNLSLSHDAIKMEYLKYLPELKKLTDVNLLGTNLTDAALKDVCKIKGLRALTISENPRLTASGLESLSQCPNLELLNIGYVKSCSDDLIPLLRKLPHLKNLDLSNTNITFAGLEKLQGLKLYYLMLPTELKMSEMERLKKLFPGIILGHGKPVSDDIKVQFAPLK